MASESPECGTHVSLASRPTLHVDGGLLATSKIFNHEQHWSRIYEDAGGNDSFRETFAADRTALVVAGALLMTVDFAALALSESSYLGTNTRNYELTFLYLVAFGIATACSLGAVISGSWQFITIQKFGKRLPREVVHYLEESIPFLFTPAMLMVISCYATVVGTCFGLYLLHGWRGAIAFGIPCITIFTTCHQYAERGMHGAEHHLHGTSSLSKRL